MASPGVADRLTGSHPFRSYALDDAYDEMFDSNGEPRSHYRLVHDLLLGMPAEEMRRRKQVADLSFLNQGITFTVYGRGEVRNGSSRTTINASDVLRV